MHARQSRCPSGGSNLCRELVAGQLPSLPLVFENIQTRIEFLLVLLDPASRELSKDKRILRFQLLRKFGLPLCCSMRQRIHNVCHANNRLIDLLEFGV